MNIDHRFQLVMHAVFTTIQTAIATGMITGDAANWIVLGVALLQTVLGIYGIYTPSPLPLKE